MKKLLSFLALALFSSQVFAAAPCGTTGQIQTNGGNGHCAAINAPSSAVVGTADAQTLTNKTISGTSNTLTNTINLTTTGSSGAATYNGSTNTLNVPSYSGGGGTPGGSTGQVQYNNSGAFGGYTNAQLTALINAFSSSLSGAVPASAGGTTNFLRADGTWAPPPAGTVTSASVSSANGFSGTVANPTTTPAITLSTTISGMIKGASGALAQATAGTDYSLPISVTSSSPDIVISPSPGTGSFTVGSAIIYNNQSLATSYTIAASDMGKTVTHNSSSAVADTLPAPTTTGFGANNSFSDWNLGSGVVTITCSSCTINGQSTLSLAQYQSAYFTNDGSTHYYAFPSSLVTSLTTTGTSGAATLVGGVLNIPTYGSAISVTAASANVVINPTPGTSTFTVGSTAVVNNQGTATTYTVVSSDAGKIIEFIGGSSAAAVSLPSASTTGFTAGFGTSIQNFNAYPITITPTSSINGNATLVLYPNEEADIISSATNYLADVKKIPIHFFSWQPGLLSAATTGKAGFYKVTKNSTVDNIEGSALSFTCSGNPTITMYECGTSSTCASPATIGSVTLTGANMVVDGTVSTPAITAGDYVAFGITAGTCTALDLSVTSQTHQN